MKKRSVTYYLIGGKILGREENGEYFLNRGSGWFRDTQCAILDRLVGYDSGEPADSPYGIGSLSIMDEIKEIPEQEAMEHLKKNASTNARPKEAKYERQ